MKNLKIKEKVTGVVLAAQAAMIGLSAPAIGRASGFDAVTVDKNFLANADPFTLVGSAIGVVLTMLQILGLALVIYGIVSVAQSIQEDQPEKRIKGFALLGSGAILIGLRFVLQAMGVIA